MWVAEDDRPFALRLARYCARNPVALERLTSEAATAQVTYRSDNAEGPTAGSETVDALEFLARLVTHIPDRGQVLTRDSGWYANRTRGMRRRAGGADGERAPPVEVAAPVSLPLRDARRRWAEWLRRIFEVDPLLCPRCEGAMRIIAFLSEPAVIDRILTHLRRRPISSKRLSSAAAPCRPRAALRTVRSRSPVCGW